jgi:anti-anti-sigma factor
MDERYQDPSRFAICLEGVRDWLTVRVRGDLDVASVGHLRAVLEVVDHDQPLIVDLSGCAFVDLTVARLLDDCGRRRRGRGELVVLDPPPSLQTVLDTTGRSDDHVLRQKGSRS